MKLHIIFLALFGHSVLAERLIQKQTKPILKTSVTGLDKNVDVHKALRDKAKALLS